MKGKFKYLLAVICLCLCLAGCGGVPERISESERGNRIGAESAAAEEQAGNSKGNPSGEAEKTVGSGNGSDGNRAAGEEGADKKRAGGNQTAGEESADRNCADTQKTGENTGDAVTDTLDDRNADRKGSANQPVSDGATLEVHYLDIGQGDSILIKQGTASMLIDAGNNDKGTTVWSYLLSRDVEKLDYTMCTHPDADHIGGMDVVLYKLDCDAVFMPAFEHDTETYEELIRTIGQRNQKVIVPKQGETYTLGEAQFEILTDTEKRYGNNNNDYSLAMRLTFGKTSFLFTGDAEVEAEQDMIGSGLTLASDVYKVAHHGANTANTEAFLNAVAPSYAVISCGEGNSYGHPRAEVLNNLRAMGVNVFRTDEQGTIVAVSDGENITFNCSPSTTWKAGEPTGSSTGGTPADGDEDEIFSASGSVTEPDAESTNGRNLTTNGNGTTMNGHNSTTNGQSDSQSGQGDYILNTNSKKFHEPGCGSVKQMSDKNKAYSNETRDELIRQGYEPCKNCEP